MKKSVELKQERTAKVEAQQALVDKAKAENRDFSEDEATQFDALTDEIRAFEPKIKRAEQIEANEVMLANRTAAPVTTEIRDNAAKEKQNVHNRVSIVKALRQAAKGNLDGAEKEMHEIGIEEHRNANIKGGEAMLDQTNLSIPLSYLGRADQQTVSQDAGAYGGNLVQDQSLRMVEQLRPTLVFEKLGAKFLTGLTGGDLPLVVGSDFDMAFMAETAAITVQKKEYDGPTLSPNRAGGAVDISNRLLLQSSPDIEAMIRMELVKGFQRLLHQSCIEGTTYITGLSTYTGVNVASGGSAVIPTWAKIVELQTLIFEDDSTRNNLGYITHPRIEGILKTISKDTGSGRFLLENGKIDMYDYVATSLITALDDNGIDCYPTFFGDFSQMYIGQWGSINVSVNPYSADLNNSLRLVLNTYADMEIANPKAFSRNLYFAETSSS